MDQIQSEETEDKGEEEEEDVDEDDDGLSALCKKGVIFLNGRVHCKI